MLVIIIIKIIMVTKTDKVIDLYKSGDHKKALRSAKDFRIGVTKDQRDAMSYAYEAMVGPSFYQQLGYNISEMIEKGERVFEILFLTPKKKNGI